MDARGQGAEGALVSCGWAMSPVCRARSPQAKVFSPDVLATLMIVVGMVPYVAFGAITFLELKNRGVLPGSKKKISPATVVPVGEQVKPVGNWFRVAGDGKMHELGRIAFIDAIA